ncbi:DUF4153 domain-containing protein [Nonomuraea spiralis]|uniref:Signal transduction histidine-protein kinase/phosphatase MprB n=1 Tax=Nonomuraea spiralis TaxID=46182 RepID=A0ABV5IAJ4_9ACTN|nr:DUF4153 domain-containing protein [Nonomuraea spiralis]GGT04029.1 hypothetical protein GCM10010176_055280 [Nonomuraea spiralis]
MRPLDFLGRIKVKLGIVIVLAVGTAFVVNEVGLNAGFTRDVRIVVAVILALIMVQVLAMGMTKPLRQMARAAQTIAKGSYGLRVSATSRDEVGELARAFNAMAADLGEVDRQRRELIANVSHELRTPITGLRAVLENVVDGVSAPDPVTMRTALAQTERLGRLVAQLLDLSRLDSGVRLIEPEAVELAPLVEQAVREASLAREDVTISPSVPAGLVVRADPDLLAQVLANLLDNAVRHSPPGGVVTVTCGAERAGARVVVADQGPGIPEASRGRVFERFSRLDAGRAADSGGAGLGLAIVKEVVELHGGSIRIDDCAGCRMVVDLPGRTTMAETPFEMGSTRTPDPQPAIPPPTGVAPTPPPPGTPPLAATGAVAGAVPEPPSETGTLASAGSLAAPSEPTGSDALAGSGALAGSDALAGSETPARSGALAGAAASASAASTPDAPTAIAPTSGVAASQAAASGAAPSVAAASAAPDSGVPASGVPMSGVPVAGVTTADVTVAGVPASGAQAAPSARPLAPASAPWPLAQAGTAQGASTPFAQPGAAQGASGPLAPAGAAHAAAWPPAQAGGVAAGGGGFARMIAGGVLGVVAGFLGGLFAAVLVSVAVGDGLALVTLVMVTALGGALGMALGDGSGRRAAYQAAYQAGMPVRTHGDPAQAQASPGQGHSGPAHGQMGPAQGHGGPAHGQGQGYAGMAQAYVPPPLFPRPELPAAPRWLLPAAAGAGVFAAVALPDAQVGLGIVLVAMVLGAAALPAVLRRMTPWTLAFGVTAYWLISMAAVRDADWLVAILLVGGAGLGALAVSGAGAGWLGVIRGGASVLLALGPVPWFLAGPLRKLTARRRIMPVLAGLGITVVLVMVFGLLFVSADAVFASYVERLTATPAWADSLPGRIFVFGLVAVLLAATVLVALRPVIDPVGPEHKFGVSRSVWLVPLVAVNLLFSSFVAVQITALFGGDGWVRRTAGLTYAEYARQGFFQLVVVSVFVLGIVAVAGGLLRTERRERWLLAVMLGLLCGLTMVVLASALHRMSLYTDAYGLSRLRISVQATVWWLGALFALVLLAGAVRLAGRGSGWLPRTIVLVTGLGLGAFAVVNPDLQVAQTQVEVRGVTKMDSDYLGDLGAEAVPALDRLPEPQRSCVLADVVRANGLGRPDPWNGWNLARAQARDLLAERPVDPSATCASASARGSD